MEVISSSRSSSSLNPNAPVFVPLAYRTVEDFSEEWWYLVHSSPWFRDYWLRERFQDPVDDSPFSDFDDATLPDEDDLFDDARVDREKEDEERREYNRELVSMGALKWRTVPAWVESPRYAEKAPKIVKTRVSPKTIQQPR
ncbi:hypothetical protein L6164_029783 [Bauhinia variegata]|uniref:Uncharacterized protein n=1 Tax=Bauhinia variegata TaxID=167791 RepID=A0ACB9LA65_BAUVA|nr:hypothetical protein L6164_029783 [Bauhinia variegata]